MIVADSNLIASCVLESEATESALRLRRQDGDWAVPRLWRYEVMNIFATLTRTGRLAPGMAERLYGPLADALRAGERDPTPASVFALCAKHGITAYDAQFVALARALECPLYTQDKELLRKFPDLARPFHTPP